MIEDGDVFRPEVRSPRMRLKLWKVLRDPRATHRDRVWFAGFALFAGIEINRLFELVDRFHAWENYNAEKTAYHLASVRRSMQTLPYTPRLDGVDVEVERVKKSAMIPPIRRSPPTPPPLPAPQRAHAPRGIPASPEELDALLASLEEEGSGPEG